MKPDHNPRYGLALADYIANLDHHRPTAADKRFRHSDSGGCVRAMCLTALGVPASNPPSVSGLWQMNMGTYGHELIEEALRHAFGETVVCEVDVLWDDDFDGSGHADARHVGVTAYATDGDTCIEVKTIGGFGFDKAIGLNRKARKLTDPQGPRASARIQGALNALALGCEELCIIYLSNETVSDSLAAQVGLRELDRFYAQWTYPRYVWEPWALAEKERVSTALAMVDGGTIPSGSAVNDDMRPTSLTIGRDWNCSASYCRHFDTCVALGPGPVPVPVELRKVAA